MPDGVVLITFIVVLVTTVVCVYAAYHIGKRDGLRASNSNWSLETRTRSNPPPTTAAPASPPGPPVEKTYRLSYEDREWLAAQFRHALEDALHADPKDEGPQPENPHVIDPAKKHAPPPTQSIMEWLDGRPILDRRPQDYERDEK